MMHNMIIQLTNLGGSLHLCFRFSLGTHCQCKSEQSTPKLEPRQLDTKHTQQHNHMHFSDISQILKIMNFFIILSLVRATGISEKFLRNNFSDISQNYASG